ncbi:MAG TPA: signal peptidase I [Pirellulales bacterium]
MRALSLLLALFVANLLFSAACLWLLGRSLKLSRLSFVRFLGAWLALFLGGVIAPAVVSTVLVSAIIRPYCCEAFRIRANSMAPTLVDEHRVAVCPRCGGQLILPLPPPGVRHPAPEEGICCACLRTSTVDASDGPIAPADRVILDKQYEPARWDLVIFNVSDEFTDGHVKFAKRVVGMPGEKVFIEDGRIHVNGKPIDLPAALHGLQYVAFPDAEFGSRETPWRLGTGEYCLLGDFSNRAKDSRFLGPVSRDDILGVITARYWPPARWKVFK